jgi:phage tail sheath protein FI
MPEYLAPGVYVEEVDTGPVPIEGVSTSTAGFVGMTQRGQTVGAPELVTSFSDFQRRFGGYFDIGELNPSFQGHLFLPFAVEGFFSNGGKRAYIMRVKAPDAAIANATPVGGLNTRLKPGEDAIIGTKTIKPITLRGFQKGTNITLNMVIDGLVHKSITLMVDKINRTTEEITLDKVIDFDPEPNKFESAFSTVLLPAGRATVLKSGQDAATAQPKATLDTVTGLQPGDKLQLRMSKNGITYESDILTIKPAGINTATGEVEFTANITLRTVNPISFEARRTTIVTNTMKLAADGLIDTTGTAPNSFKIKAIDEGDWGNKISVQVTHSTAARSTLDKSVGTGGVMASGVDNNQLALNSAAGFYKGAWVEIDRGDEKRYRRVKNVATNVITLEGAALNAAAVAPQPPATDTVVSTCEFRLTATYDGIVEQFSGLALENVAGKYCVDIVNSGSNLIQIDPTSVPANTHPFIFPSAPDGLLIPLTNGSDGTAPPSDLNYRGVDNGPGNRTGIRALEDIDQISIIAAPGLTGQVVQNALIEQCERLMDRFAILDPAPRTGNAAPNLTDVQNQRRLYDTKYAAIYYPRLLVTDPASGNEIAVPPSGHMAGIYARTDIERGVHKAPANEVIRSILGLELTINKGEQDILNPSPNNINVLRDFRADGRGYRVWGARCITSESAWKYVPVRRLFIFLEESIDEGTQWVVFEPNDEPLWARVRQSVSNFLVRVWRDGALMGTTAEQAFFVRCDNTTMTQDDIDNGRLIMLIGVAPVKPAEFVIIRIGQKAGGAEIEEL